MPRFNPDDYIAVQDRINRFWTEYPEGAIRTNLMADPLDYDKCRYKASIYKHRENPEPDATGWAFESAGTSDKDGANFGSHEENCETSAIGRALANLGYATSAKERPSREEMSKATAPAEPGTTPPDRTPGGASMKSRGLALVLAEELGMTEADRHKMTKDLFRKGGSLNELTQREMSQFIDELKKLQQAIGIPTR